MKTCNFITALFLLLAAHVAYAQDTYLWPIPNKQVGDSILNYTQQLICESKYIYYVEPEPEPSSIEEDAHPFRWWWGAIGVAAVLLVGIVGTAKKPKKGL